MSVGVAGDARPRAGSQRLRARLLSSVALGIALGFGLCGVNAVARADDVDIATSTDDGFVLDGFAGTTVQVVPDLTVSNTSFNLITRCHPHPMQSSRIAVCGTTTLGP